MSNITSNRLSTQNTRLLYDASPTGRWLLIIGILRSHLPIYGGREPLCSHMSHNTCHPQHCVTLPTALQTVCCPP